MKYLLATHVKFNENASETFGPAHNIFDFLVSTNKNPTLIKHCIDGSYNSEIATKKSKYLIGNRLVKGKLKYIENIVVNLSLAKKNKEPLCYIGFDPINGLSGAVLKKYFNINTFIYFTPDYADKRFGNFLLNKIYHLLDQYCLKHCDEVWSVSSRIVNKRKEQGVDDKKNKFVPNSPDFSKTIRHKYDSNHNLVIVSHLSKSLDFGSILKIVKKVLEKKEHVKLLVIGSGPEEDRFKSIANNMKIGKHVIFLGQKTHEEVLEQIANSFLGFAIYTQENDWNYYGDSMKAREYVACGIPVIINDVPSTADEIENYHAGIVLKGLDIKKTSEFILNCLNDKKYYLQLKSNAIRLGKDFDKNKILNGLLGKHD